MSKYPIETLCARCDKRLHAHFFGDCCVDETPRPDTPRFLSRHIPTEQDAELSALRAEVEGLRRERDASIAVLEGLSRTQGMAMPSLVEAEVARLRKALAPFAEFESRAGFARTVFTNDETRVLVAREGSDDEVSVLRSDFRRAAAALAGLGEPDA